MKTGMVAASGIVEKFAVHFWHSGVRQDLVNKSVRCLCQYLQALVLIETCTVFSTYNTLQLDKD